MKIYHHPYGWVILELPEKYKTLEASYKLFTDWGDSFRLNSGITNVTTGLDDQAGTGLWGIEVGEDELLFEGVSGTSYLVERDCEGVASTYCAYILANFVDNYGLTQVTYEDFKDSTKLNG